MTDDCVVPKYPIRAAYDDTSQVKFFFNTFHVVPKLNSENEPSVQSALDVIRKTANQVGSYEVKAVDIRPNTLIVAVGGDGTMLEAMRISASTGATAIGVNLGRIGFLTEIDNQRHLAHAISAALTLRTDTFVEERLLLKPFIDGAPPAVNEISVSQLYADALITYRLRIGNMDAGVHRANGILIATPTGSTAYTLSVGGSLMLPEMDAIQIVPVAPATMTSRPIIVPSNTPIELQVWGGDITVRADGQVIDPVAGWHPPPSTKIAPYRLLIGACETKAKVLHFSGWNFFDVLTEKLGWKHE